MNLQKIQWKLFFKTPSEIKPDDFFRIFNTWIPGSEEIFVDVADYSHTHDGPVTLLVGHYLDYALDNTDLKLGFLYSHKQPLAGNNQEKLAATLKRFLQACQRLGMEFKTNEIFFQINDRALAPSTPKTFAALKPDLICFLDGIFTPGSYTLKPQNEPKKRFGILIKIKENQSITDLITKIS